MSPEFSPESLSSSMPVNLVREALFESGLVVDDFDSLTFAVEELPDLLRAYAGDAKKLQALRTGDLANGYIDSAVDRLNLESTAWLDWAETEANQLLSQRPEQFVVQSRDLSFGSLNKLCRSAGRLLLADDRNLDGAKLYVQTDHLTAAERAAIEAYRRQIEY